MKNEAFSYACTSYVYPMTVFSSRMTAYVGAFKRGRESKRRSLLMHAYIYSRCRISLVRTCVGAYM